MTRDDIIFGRRPVLEMLEKGIKPEKILLQKGVDPEFNRRLRSLAKALEVQVQVVPWQKLKALTRATHQGVIAFRAFVEYQRVQDVVHRVFEQAHRKPVAQLSPAGLSEGRATGCRCSRRNRPVCLDPEDPPKPR